MSAHEKQKPGLLERLRAKRQQRKQALPTVLTVALGLGAAVRCPTASMVARAAVSRPAAVPDRRGV
jgi:predicted Zn-dependent protease